MDCYYFQPHLFLDISFGRDSKNFEVDKLVGLCGRLVISYLNMENDMDVFQFVVF